jgi:hypothetical protein
MEGFLERDAVMDEQVGENEKINRNESSSMCVL